MFWRVVGRNQTVNKTWLKGRGMLVQATVGFCVGERAFQLCVVGQGEGKNWNLPCGWERETKGEKAAG